MFYSHKLFGQEHAQTFIRNAFSKGHIAHAYLFSGKKGVGKRLLAMQCAKSLLCETTEPLAECTCQSCQKVHHGVHTDVHWVDFESQARSIKINDIREVQSWANLTPLESKRKVCIINNADLLTEEAANAFLKTLEEPPENTYIILLAANSFVLPATIISRVVEVQLYPLAYERLAEVLTAEFDISDGAHFLAYQAQGSIGLALAYHQDNFFQVKNAIIDAFMQQHTGEYFMSMMHLAQDEIDKLLHVLSGFLHDMLLAKHMVDATLFINQDRTQDIIAFCNQLSGEQIIHLVNTVEKARQALERNVNRKLVMAQLAAQSELVKI